MDIAQRLKPQPTNPANDLPDHGTGLQVRSRLAPTRAASRVNTTAALFGAVLVVGCFARFEALASTSLWHDESWSWAIIQCSWTDIIRRTAADVHPPFYFLVLKSWVEVLGDSVVAMRGLSAFIGMIVLLAMGPLVVTLHRTETSRPRAYHIALLAIAVLALNPYVLSRAREIRMYPLGSLLAILSSWALLIAVRGPRRPFATWTVYVAAAIALLYTHNYGLFTVAAQGLFLVGLILSRTLHVRSASSNRPLLAPAALAFFSVTLAYAPWVPVLMKQRDQVVENYYTHTLDGDVVAGALEQFFLDKQEQRHSVAGWTSIGIVGLVLSSLLICPRLEDVYLFLLAGFPLLAGVVLSLVQGRDILIGRCLYFSFPFFVIAMAQLVARLPDRAVAVAAGWLLLTGSITPWLLSRVAGEPTVAPGMRAAAAVVRADARPGDLIITVDSDGFLGMSYYVRGLPVLYLTRSGSPLDHFRGAAVIPRRAIVEPDWLRERGAGRLWLLSSSVRPDGRSWIPGGWSSLWSTRYADSVPHRSEVYLELFGREPSAGSEPGGRG